MGVYDPSSWFYGDDDDYVEPELDQDYLHDLAREREVFGDW